MEPEEREIEMSLIGNDFVIEPTPYQFRCAECHKKVRKGESCQVARRFGKVQKRLCANKQCRVDFDDAYWQERARQNQEESR